MPKRKRERRAVSRKKRGPGPVAAILLAGMVCCWMGLVKVDRQIRAVTINHSPPPWESQAAGDEVRLTILGRRVAVDLSPLQRVQKEAALLLETPPAPVRAVLDLWAVLEKETKPPKHSWKKGFL